MRSLTIFRINHFGGLSSIGRSYVLIMASLCQSGYKDIVICTAMNARRDAFTSQAQLHNQNYVYGDNDRTAACFHCRYCRQDAPRL